MTRRALVFFVVDKLENAPRLSSAEIQTFIEQFERYSAQGKNIVLQWITDEVTLRGLLVRRRAQTFVEQVSKNRRFRAAAEVLRPR